MPTDYRITVVNLSKELMELYKAMIIPAPHCSSPASRIRIK